MNVRHDLSGHAVVGHVVREGDDSPVVALFLEDKAADVQIGIRIRTLDQARALARAAQAALEALEDEIEDAEAGRVAAEIERAGASYETAIPPKAIEHLGILRRGMAIDLKAGETVAWLEE